jgi:adenylate kinase family enzyme
MKVMIVGISGTGKSTMGLQLAEATGWPLFHMDSIIWSPHNVETPEDDIRRALAKIAPLDHWIVEGWTDSYSNILLQKADIILDLDYPGYLAA